jgi:hypothetical protein
MKDKQMNCDILVVGAGVSGVAAAVAAARRGTSVILLEQNKFPGGTAVIAMHNSICGLSRHSKGLLKEILNKIAPKEKLIKRGKVLILPFKREQMVLGLTRIIKSEKNIRVFYNNKVVSAKILQNRVSLVIAKSASGKVLINPKVAIDASGEGDLIRLSGAEYSISSLSNRQLSGFSFMVKNIKGNNEDLAWKVPYYLIRGVKAGKLPEYFRFSLFSPAHSRGEGFIRVNIPYSEQKRDNKFTNRVAIFIHNYLRKSLPEFRGSNTTRVSSCVSSREGLRLLGEYILRKKDVLSQKKFLDVAAYGYWPIEFWHKKDGLRFKYLKGGSFYEIPLRCLKSKNISNLFAAGRCISADPYALASTRVLGTCISLGEAAGIAASKLYAHNFS